jgi:hypothetical protein
LSLMGAESLREPLAGKVLLLEKTYATGRKCSCDSIFESRRLAVLSEMNYSKSHVHDYDSAC